MAAFNTSRTVQEFMTPSPHGIEPHETLAVARQRMDELKARHLPVRSGGRVVGILTDRDMLLLANVGVDFKHHQVGLVMSPDPYSVAADEPLAAVAATMAMRRISSALIVDAAGKLVGIFTDTDALCALAALAGPGEGNRRDSLD